MRRPLPIRSILLSPVNNSCLELLGVLGAIFQPASCAHNFDSFRPRQHQTEGLRTSGSIA